MTEKDFEKNIPETVRCFLLIFCCFSLGSAAYLSWTHHLLSMPDVQSIDRLNMVTAYLIQAAGVGLTALAEKRGMRWHSRPVFLIVLVLFFLCCVPALLSPYAAGTIIFGLLMNLLTGITAGYYLHDLSRSVPAGHRGLVFGGGYAASAITVWLLSLIGGNNFLRTNAALIVYAVLAVFSLLFLPAKPAAETLSAGTPDKQDLSSAGFRRLVILGTAVIFLLSLTKNIGFSFPSSDLLQGVNLELSRVFYAVGLVAAGLISDRGRKYGAVCSLAALIIPFILLALSGEPISATIFWALGYLFFGFFTVFRILFFSDLAQKPSAAWLAGFGLLFGRAGDAVGTEISLSCAGRLTVLVIVSALFFIFTVFLFFRLYPQAYVPVTSQKKSDREVFEDFSSRHDLSVRERAVLRLVLEDRSNAEIAQSLYVSESTVKFHIHNLLKKTGCQNRVELTASYYRSEKPGNNL